MASRARRQRRPRGRSAQPPERAGPPRDRRPALLPTTYAAGRFPELLDAMRVDKKSRGDLLRFVVLDGIGRPGLLEGPDPALLAAAYAEVAKETS